MTNRNRELSIYKNIYVFDEWANIPNKDHQLKLSGADLVLEYYFGKYLVIKDTHNPVNNSKALEIVTKDQSPELFL